MKRVSPAAGKQGSTESRPNRARHKPERKENKADTLENLIEELINQLRKRLKDPKAGDGLHTTVSDLTKILQLKRELTPEQPKEVTVRWVEEKVEEEV